MVSRPAHRAEELEKIRRALHELAEKRDVFTHETYTQIFKALYDKQRELLTDRDKRDSLIDDEWRLVTVMFIDVVDSTYLAQQMADEAWRLVIGGLHEWLSRQVMAWDGEIGQYLGDGLLCFFGASRSRGDDAIRAVSCALAIQAEVLEQTKRILSLIQTSEKNISTDPSAPIEDLKVRIGISTGRTVVGIIGTEEKAETLAVGTTTNRAARLQSISPKGGIAIDEETYRQTRGAFVTIQQEPTILKGFASKVTYYHVERHRPQLENPTLTQIGGMDVPFVGRESILNLILDYIRDYTAEAGRSVMIYGDVGLGKTRLLDQIAHHAHQMNRVVLRISGHYESRKQSYAIIGDMLTALYRSHGRLTSEIDSQQIRQTISDYWEAAPDTLAFVIPRMLYLMGFEDEVAHDPQVLPLYSTTTPNPNLLRFETVCTWLNGTLGEQPIVLLIDNLQWYDSDSIGLVGYITQHLPNSRVISTALPEFATQQIVQRIGRLTPLHFELTPFTESEARALVNTLLDNIENVPNYPLDVIVERAEGNPLFIEEFMRMLFDYRVFEQREDGTWRFNSFQYRSLFEESELPKGLLGVFQARLDDMPPHVRRGVQIAAVIGQTFWESAIHAIVGAGSESILRNLLAKGIIEEHPQSLFEGEREFGFRNTLYHEVAYTMLTTPARQRYHQQLIAWFEARAWHNPDTLGLLADQYMKAGQPLDALRTYVEAAQTQVEHGHLGETLRLVEAGQITSHEVSREDGLPLVSRLWLIQARATHSRRRYAETTAAAQSALRLLAELPEQVMVHERVLAAVTLGNAYTSMGEYDMALEALNEAHDMISDAGSSSAQQRSVVLRAHGLLFWSRGYLEEAYNYQKRALLEARMTGSQRELAASLSMLGRIALDQGAVASALDCFEQVLKINTEGGNLLYQIMDMRLIAVTYTQLFAFDDALALLDKADELSQQIQYESPLLHGIRGQIAVIQGDYAHGLARLEQAANAEYNNTYDHYDVELAYIKGLALAGEYDQCVARAQSFTETAGDHNVLLFGRGVLWQGLAMYKLGDERALAALRTAFNNETHYMGGALWLCHYALSLVHPNPTTAHKHREAAFAHLHDIADTLHAAYPALSQHLTDPATVDRLFANWHPPQIPIEEQ